MGGRGRHYWIAPTCAWCGAWLNLMPQRHEARGSHYVYFRDCVACGAVNEQTHEAPPSQWVEAPIHDPILGSASGSQRGEVGSFPEHAQCRVDQRLVDDIFELTSQFVVTDDPGVIRGKDSLLDHEGRQLMPGGRRVGSDLEPTGVRHALAYLRHGQPRRDGARGVEAVVESAVLVTAAVYVSAPEALTPPGRCGQLLELPVAVEVGPVVGTGDDSLYGRYRRRGRHGLGAPREAEHLRARIHAGEQLLSDISMWHTADTQSEYRSDLDRVVESTREWLRILRSERRRKRDGPVPL
jgi:hypothetical protein